MASIRLRKVQSVAFRRAPALYGPPSRGGLDGRTGDVKVGKPADMRAAVLLIAALTVVRLVTLFSTPLELYPDEAQYWLWSRTLDFGYYSKPPVIAWAIWATTRLGGDAEPWIRLSAPLFQAGASLIVFAIARRLYGAPAALAATALYVLMPAVQLSSLVAATDAPLLFFLGLTIWAWTRAADGGGARAAGAGARRGGEPRPGVPQQICGGLRGHRHRPAPGDLGQGPAAAGRRPPSRSAVLAFGAILAPNVIWNARQRFRDPAPHRGQRRLGRTQAVQPGPAGRVRAGPVSAPSARSPSPCSSRGGGCWPGGGG